MPQLSIDSESVNVDNCCAIFAEKVAPSPSCHHCTHRGSIGHDVCKAVTLKSGLHICIEDAKEAAKDCANYEWDGVPWD